MEKQMASGGAGAAAMASAAAVAAATVNAAVAMRTLDAPDTERSYVNIETDDARAGVVDDVGLPLVYDKVLIQEYWKKESGALRKRWSEFLGYSVPFLTRLVTIVIGGGTQELQERQVELTQDARIIMEKLGPTYVKMGQMLSVRPDVLPKVCLLVAHFRILFVPRPLSPKLKLPSKLSLITTSFQSNQNVSSIELTHGY
jgi:hypothetical protein